MSENELVPLLVTREQARKVQRAMVRGLRPVRGFGGIRVSDRDEALTFTTGKLRGRGRRVAAAVVRTKVADGITYIDEENPDTNYSTAINMHARNDGANERRILVPFSGIGDGGWHLLLFRVKSNGLYVASTTGAVPSAEFQVRLITSSFDYTTVTWNTKPTVPENGMGRLQFSLSIIASELEVASASLRDTISASQYLSFGVIEPSPTVTGYELRVALGAGTSIAWARVEDMLPFLVDNSDMTEV